MDNFPTPEDLALPESAAGPIPQSRRPPRHRPGEPFLKGPIPLGWLDRAGRSPGKALTVGLVLWQRAGMTQGRTVQVCQAQIDLFGLNEDSARRGLKALESAGLVSIRRLPGRGLEVTLLEGPTAKICSGGVPTAEKPDETGGVGVSRQ